MLYVKPNFRGSTILKFSLFLLPLTIIDSAFVFGFYLNFCSEKRQTVLQAKSRLGVVSWRISFSAPSKASLINVAIKAREEQINLFFRAVATKRSEVNLKGGLEGLSI